MTISVIPLCQRLQNLEETGFSDPNLLTKALYTWAKAQASGFFSTAEQWERMQEILVLSPEDGAVITYRQMARMIQKHFEGPCPGTSTFVEAILLLGEAFCDSRPLPAIFHVGGGRKVPLARRLNLFGGYNLPCITRLRTQAIARAVDELTDKPVHYAGIVHDVIAAHYVPEDKKKIKIQGALHLAKELPPDTAASIYYYLLVFPFTLI